MSISPTNRFPKNDKRSFIYIKIINIYFYKQRESLQQSTSTGYGRWYSVWIEFVSCSSTSPEYTIFHCQCERTADLLRYAVDGTSWLSTSTIEGF